MASSSSTVIDINHPYFLNSSASRSVKIALSARLKLGFIDGSQTQPNDNSALLPLWKRSNDLVISWLLNYVSNDIRKSIVFMQTAKQIWDDLAIRYAQNNVPRLFNLHKELASLTQGSRSITAYFTHFLGLMDELEALAPIHRCVCDVTTCACGVTLKLIQYEQQMKLRQFLMGLNDQFTASRGQIMLISPLPDMSQAYAMLLQDDNQRNSSGGSLSFSHDSVAMNTRVSSAKKSFVTKKDDKKASDVVCDYCSMSGHSREKCFALHGYPEWYRLFGHPKPKIKHNVKKSATANVQSVTQTLQQPDVSSDKSVNS
ncbi:uncharacterized protein LOC141719908 [Apium graveolens]|uniref:uncharacterized protein LOC141719908 n=1 Tax=Apium graveolens TaxID=4045 RepID=UPI003D7BA72D